MKQYKELFAITLIFNIVVQIRGSPGQIETILSSGRITDYDTYANVHNSHYKLTINYIRDADGSCFKQIIVTGKGIGDSFDTPCAKKLTQAIYTFVSPQVLMYGDPSVDDLALFTESRSKNPELVVIHNYKCTKRIYTTVERETSHTISEFSDEACHRLSQKISNREYEQQHHSFWN